MYQRAQTWRENTRTKWKYTWPNTKNTIYADLSLQSRADPRKVNVMVQPTFRKEKCIVDWFILSKEFPSGKSKENVRESHILYPILLHESVGNTVTRQHNKLLAKLGLTYSSLERTFSALSITTWHLGHHGASHRLRPRNYVAEGNPIQVKQLPENRLLRWHFHLTQGEFRNIGSNHFVRV